MIDKSRFSRRQLERAAKDEKYAERLKRRTERAEVARMQREVRNGYVVMQAQRIAAMRAEMRAEVIALWKGRRCRFCGALDRFDVKPNGWKVECLGCGWEVDGTSEEELGRG